MTSATVTVQIPADLAWYLKLATAEASAVWHNRWRDVADGNRTDLDATACASISSKTWELWELLDSQGV